MTRFPAAALAAALAAAAALAFGAPNEDPKAGKTLSASINEVVDKGVAHVRSLQAADGSFNTGEQAVGYTALAIYALLKGGVPPGDPAITKALAFIKGKPLERTYSVGTLILALDALGNPEFDPLIR